MTPAVSLTRGRRVERAAGEAAQGPPTLPAALQDVRVLAFDTFGTVVDWRSGVIAEGEALGKAKGLTVDWANFAERGGEPTAPPWSACEKGSCPGRSSTCSTG